MKKLTLKIPICSSGTSSRKLSALSVFILSPLFMLAQLGGIWYGELENDSTHKKQNFELGLSEYRGKITGYTYTTFIENDTFYYSIKRIKAEKKDGLLIITDDEMVGNNFPERAAKHVKQTTVFPLINDSTFDISKGSWSTNRTKRYYSIKGSAAVKEQEDRSQSDLIAHLEEMKVKTDITVKKPQKNVEQPVVKNNPVEKKAEINKEQNNVLKKEEALQKEEVTRSQPTNTRTEIKPVAQPASERVQNNNTGSVTKPVITNSPAVVKQINSPQNTGVQPQPQQNNSSLALNKPVTNAPPVIKQTSTAQDPIAKKTEQPLVNPDKMEAQKANAVVSAKKDSLVAKPLPQLVATRKNETIQTLYFHSDSLVLSIYDNGVVDGDTVSVFFNGNAVISKQQLKVSAFKKTVYITPDMDSVQLVLFADNLGSIPPNTGLLTVRDGDQTYNVRFSADLQKNAAIVLRRKE